MAFDPGLAQRIGEILEANQVLYDERRMFGGLAYMVNGHMCVGIIDSRLMVRVGPDEYVGALAQPHVKEMDFTGKSLKGFVYVTESGIESDDDLQRWIYRAHKFVLTLPPR